MTKLGIVGDIHLSVTPPGRRAEGYLEQIQAKLNEIAREGQDVDAWLLIGDLLHHKSAARNPPALMLWLWEWLGQLSVEVDTRGITRPVYIVPGNHDLADGTIESLDRQPLALLEKHPAVTVCRGIFDTFAPGRPEPTPTLFSWSPAEHAMAVPGTGAVCDAKVPAQEAFEWEGCRWVWAHAPIDFKSRPWATYDAETLPLHSDTKGIIYGHQHDKAGARRRADGKLVIATGAISRGSVTEAEHVPAWLVLDTQTEDVEVRQIACARPASEVYRWAERTAERAADATMTAFTDALAAETLQGFSREGLIEAVRTRADLDATVRAEAVQILEAG